MWNSFLVECVASFIFISTIMVVVYEENSEGVAANVITIGAVLYGSISITGGISGGVINPALGLV